MTNPIWEKPGLSFGSDFYFIIPQAIFSHIHLIMRSLISEAGILTSLEKRRAKFLESEVIEAFKTVLKYASYHPNFTGKYKGKDFETDLIIKIDRTLVIAEAKSAALSAEALRGAKDRIKRHIDDLVVDPSVQSARIQAIVRDAQSGDEEAEQILGAIGIDAKSIDHIIRVSVTLDDFSIICSAEQELKAAGLVDDSVDLPTTISIADLHVICRILDAPEHLLHYFLERARIQKTIGVLGDELDYLGLYCRTGFNLGELEKSDANLIITGMSGDIDRYQNSLDAGVILKKPQPQIHPYFKAVLKEVKRRNVTGWLTMAMDILRCGNFDEQVKFIAAVNTLRKSVPKQYHDPKHRCCIIIKPPEPRNSLILLHVFPQNLFEQRKDVSGQIAYEQLKETGRKRCLIIGRMVEEWERPYHYIGVAINSREDEN